MPFGHPRQLTCRVPGRNPENRHGNLHGANSYIRQAVYRGLQASDGASSAWACLERLSAIETISLRGVTRHASLITSGASSRRAIAALFRFFLDLLAGAFDVSTHSVGGVAAAGEHRHSHQKGECDHRPFEHDCACHHTNSCSGGGRGNQSGGTLKAGCGDRWKALGRCPLLPRVVQIRAGTSS